MAKKAVNAPAPPPPRQTLARSVQAPPISVEAGPGGGNAFTLWMASIADHFEPWGREVVKRDKELRDFWHTEPNLAGAVYTCAGSNASFEWEVDGPEATVEAVHDILNQANLGKGWRDYANKISVDLYTQDNGAFTEIIRERNSPDAPVIGISHLDAAHCQRTGDLNFPVIYTDRQGTRHKMPWYSIITHEEFPSPVESMYGVQYSAVTRVLRAAQVLRDMTIYRGEKAGGRFAEAIHVVGGVKTKDIDDIRERAGETADNQGLVRYMGPLIIGSLDPASAPSVATLDLRSLPEAFSLDEELRWYISSLALGFGRDYQDFAPLPGRGLGTSTQSEVLHMKSRGKGPAAFMRLMEQAFNFHGVMPRTVTFRFQEQDIEAERQEAEVRKLRAETRKIQIESLEIPPVIARQLAQDDGDLKPEYVEAIGEEDVTPGEPVEGGEKPGADGRPVRQIVEAPVEEPAPADREKDMLDTMLRSLRRKARGFPQLEAMIEDSKEEATLASRVQSLSDFAEELQGSMDSLAAENERKKEIIDQTMAALAQALRALKQSQEDREASADAAKRAEERMRQLELDSTVVQSFIHKRDGKGLAMVVRKKMASGRIVDYKVIRGKDGKTESLKAIG